MNPSIYLFLCCYAYLFIDFLPAKVNNASLCQAERKGQHCSKSSVLQAFHCKEWNVDAGAPCSSLLWAIYLHCAHLSASFLQVTLGELCIVLGSRASARPHQPMPVLLHCILCPHSQGLCCQTELVHCVIMSLINISSYQNNYFLPLYIKIWLYHMKKEK